MTTETLTVLYDGGCPLCRREIAHARRLAAARGGAGLAFVDIAEGSTGCALPPGTTRAQLLARFHVRRADGQLLDGAAAFAAMWSRLPGWRWLARLARLPGGLAVMERSYRAFLRLRPRLQRLAARWELAPGLSPHLTRELRSDHAGETGAVSIYRGMAAVARRRGDATLLVFAERHGATEAEHLALIAAWLPPPQRSRLLGPWRLAGWLTGALPALFGAGAAHATVAAVERFVDHHYQQQIDHLRAHGGPVELLALLVRCQADERHHRDEAAALAPAPGWLLRTWCTLVGAGSAVAVSIARRF